MKATLTLTLILFAACALAAGCHCSDKCDEPETTGDPEPGVSSNETAYTYPDPEPEHARAYKEKGWALYVNYVAKGSKSEGVHGALYHDGVEVFGKQKGETLDTPLGKMTWKGSREKCKHLFDPSGWHAENANWMRPSWAENLP